MSSAAQFAQKNTNSSKPHSAISPLTVRGPEAYSDGSGLRLIPRRIRHSLTIERPPALFGLAARLLKRLFDVVGVSLLGLVALPLLGLIAMAVKLDSRGPVFFGHTRIGRGGRVFYAWKFRSMVPNATEVLEQHLHSNPLARAEWRAKQKLRHDPRVTRLGHWLRRTSLDELPQLWNVLVGEMSLVGPRPIIESERFHYREKIALYEGVLPGLSGLWQVSGRSNTTYEERVELDSYYVTHWSLWLDISILLKTIPAAFFGRGAC